MYPKINSLLERLDLKPQKQTPIQPMQRHVGRHPDAMLLGLRPVGDAEHLLGMQTQRLVFAQAIAACVPKRTYRSRVHLMCVVAQSIIHLSKSLSFVLDPQDTCPSCNIKKGNYDSDFRR